MFNTTVIIFVLGWVLWFLIDKHPASLGVLVPNEMDTMLNNFQIAFNLLSAGFVRASYVFIWKAHYIIVSIILSLLVSVIYGSVSNVLRRRNLRKVMWSNIQSTDRQENNKIDIDDNH